MPSRLVVLGSCGAWPEADRACSGFLLEHDGFRIVVDLGYGTLPRLLSVLGSSHADGLDAVVITHRHADHMVDLHALFRARSFARPKLPPLPLYSPASVLDLVIAMEEGGEGLVRATFEHLPLPANPYDVGPFLLESVALPHFVPNAGIRLSAANLVVAYTGDTGPDEALVELGREADLYVMEATDRFQQASTPPARSARQLHLTAHEAGEFASRAGPRRLLLTHFWPGNDREASRASAATAFSGVVLSAEEGLEVPLP